MWQVTVEEFDSKGVSINKAPFIVSAPTAKGALKKAVEYFVFDVNTAVATFSITLTSGVQFISKVPRKPKNA